MESYSDHMKNGAGNKADLLWAKRVFLKRRGLEVAWGPIKRFGDRLSALNFPQKYMHSCMARRRNIFSLFCNCGRVGNRWGHRTGVPHLWALPKTFIPVICNDVWGNETLLWFTTEHYHAFNSGYLIRKTVSAAIRSSLPALPSVLHLILQERGG